jgi:hypothetical protein
MKISSGIQKFLGVDGHRQQGDLISLLLFVKNKERGLQKLCTQKEPG